MKTIDETIDERIAQAREVSATAREDVTEYLLEGREDYAQLREECAEESDQLADWLEELKAYKEIGTVQGYQSAIDSYNTEHTLRLDAEQRLYELTQKILGYIQSGNRGNSDYFIVDQIEELLEGDNNG